MEVEESKNLMTEGTIWKKIIFFALPLFLGNLFQQLYNTADSLIVGNFLGSNALAAVSSSGNLIFLMVGFFNGIAIGAGVVIARYFGARDIDNMQRAIHTTVAFGLFQSDSNGARRTTGTSDSDLDGYTGECFTAVGNLFPHLFHGLFGACHVQHLCGNPAGGR